MYSYEKPKKDYTTCFVLTFFSQTIFPLLFSPLMFIFVFLHIKQKQQIEFDSAEGMLEKFKLGIYISLLCFIITAVITAIAYFIMFMRKF